jgi:hypothetical protein
LTFFFDKTWGLPTPKSIWGGQKKVISNGLAKINWQNAKCGKKEEHEHAHTANTERKRAGSTRQTHMPSGRNVCIYAKQTPSFAKLTKMQSPYAKRLDRSF